MCGRARRARVQSASAANSRARNEANERNALAPSVRWLGACLRRRPSAIARRPPPPSLLSPCPLGCRSLKETSTRRAGQMTYIVTGFQGLASASQPSKGPCLNAKRCFGAIPNPYLQNRPVVVLVEGLGVLLAQDTQLVPLSPDGCLLSHCTALCRSGGGRTEELTTLACLHELAKAAAATFLAPCLLAPIAAEQESALSARPPPSQGGLLLPP